MRGGDSRFAKGGKEKKKEAMNVPSGYDATTGGNDDDECDNANRALLFTCGITLAPFGSRTLYTMTSHDQFSAAWLMDRPNGVGHMPYREGTSANCWSLNGVGAADASTFL
jgi:hypothetical protein